MQQPVLQCWGGGARGTSIRLALAVVSLAALAGCTGKIGANGGGSGTVSIGSTTYGPTGLHRLSRIEYDNTLADLLGDRSRSGFASLPEDVNDPFDNDFSTQIVSGALIGSAEELATAAATRALADAARRDALVGCTPSGPGDQACLESFVRAFGRRAFRRPLTDEEVTGYRGLSAFAVEANDFYVGVDLALRAILQDPNFLYRVETGTAVSGKNGLYVLDDYQIGARLSYFLWGSTPSDRLLDMAASGALSTDSGRRAAATELLTDPRGAERIKQFHAFWLAYDQLPVATDMATAMRAETDALIQRVVFDRRGDYFDLFNATETFVNDTLATHYGLTPPGSTTGAWVPYGSSPRRGILSHGTLLAAGAKFDDTSPTLRGVFVRNRLLCQVIAPPPPTVAVDEPPTSTGSSNCKVDRYAAHRSGGCATCHNQTDPIGFGLENYDRTGAYRATDKDNPQCAISGDGEVVGLGTFNGPAQLADLIAGSGNLESCLVTQLYRMALGRRESAGDMPTLTKLSDGFKQSGRKFDELLVEVIADPAFIHRQLEP
jgi:hypothetical protein